MAIGLGSEIVAGIMILVGAVLYSKALFVSYSFILYVACAFTFLVSTGLILSGNLDDNTDPGEIKYSAPSQRLSHHEQVDSHDSNVYDDSAGYVPPA